MSYVSTVLADSPFWYFRMNETGGLYARSYGTAAGLGMSAGVPQGSTTSMLNVTPGYTGIAADGGSFLLAYDGSMYISSQTPAATVQWTFEAWVAVGTTTDGGIGQTHRLWGFMGEPATVFVSLFDVKNNLTVQVVDNTSATHGNTYQATPGYLDGGGFHHLVLSVGASTTVTYVDGVALTPQLSLTPASWDYNPALHGARMTLGNFAGTATTRAGIFFSEVAFYRSALSSGQVAAHHAARETNNLPRWRGGLTGVCT